MKYLLLIMWFGTTPPMSTQIDLTSKQACDKAKDAVWEQWKLTGNKISEPFMVCIER
jgi:hypothetical protein